MTQIITPPSPELTCDLMNPLLGSIDEVFEVQLHAKVTRREVEHYQPDSPLYPVTAQIGITGSVKGLVAIGFQTHTTMQVVSRLTQERCQHVTPAALDGVGELANMIVGAAKSKLNLGLNIGLPVVEHERERPIEFPQASRPMRLRCESGLGAFAVDFGFVVRA